MRQLQEAERRLHDLQMSKGVNEFKTNFEHNRQVMFNKMEQLKTFKLGTPYLKLDSYSQNP